MSCRWLSLIVVTACTTEGPNRALTLRFPDGATRVGVWAVSAEPSGIQATVKTYDAWNNVIIEDTRILHSDTGEQWFISDGGETGRIRRVDVLYTELPGNPGASTEEALYQVIFE